MPLAQDSPLAPLTALAELKKGREAYLLELTKSEDRCISVGGWVGLIEGGFLVKRPELWNDLLGKCGYAALRLRAFEFFENVVFEHELAARVAACATDSFLAALEDKMRADLRCDFAAGLDADLRAFLASGQTSWLWQAHDDAEYSGGWRQSLPWSVRAVMLDPTNIVLHRSLLEEIRNTSNAAMLDQYADILATAERFAPLIDLVRAAADSHHDQPQNAVTRLNRWFAAPAASQPPFQTVKALAFELKAAAEEALGQFERSHRDFVLMNQSSVPENIDPEDFYRKTAAKKQLAVPVLPKDPRTDVVQMLGYPRSGTTLLENALAAHPQIETFEEIPALNAAIDAVELVLRDRAEKLPTTADVFLRSRAHYYEEIDIRRRKTGATRFIDKMPLRTSEAAFIEKLFPDWHYIFSVRHPCDVILSCFKQRFVANAAMENFRTIAGAIRAYDLSMSEWFSIHTLSDPAVHYVRYDELVTDFDRVLTATLQFLGLEWDERVREFATAAQARASRTPSYRKVRQGIGIGVQTYWRDYKFVFDIPEAKPLFKWAEFFGYPTA